MDAFNLTNTIKIGDGQPLVVLAGPCVAESLDICRTIAEKAAAVCQTKLGQGLLSAFILAIFCNIMIFIAVEGYKSIPHELGKYLAIFFGVTVFVVCGFEHCVANMYYFTVGKAWSMETGLYLLVMTAGNALGGVSVPLLRKMIKG